MFGMAIDYIKAKAADKNLLQSSKKIITMKK